MIDKAKSAGADAVKLQTFNPSEHYLLIQNHLKHLKKICLILNK